MTTARIAGDVWFEFHEEIIFSLRSVVVPTLHRLTARNMVTVTRCRTVPVATAENTSWLFSLEREGCYDMNVVIS